MKAWLFQEKRDVEKHGVKKAPWSVGWYGLDGKRHKKKRGLKTAAEAFKRKIERELADGVDSATAAVDWAKFREQYERDHVSRLAARSQQNIVNVFRHFERICQPKRLSAITPAMLDGYATRRLEELGRQTGSTTAPSTIKLELTLIRNALLQAVEWGYLPRAPRVKKPRVPERIGKVVSPTDFEAIYAACEVATRPAGRRYEPAEWWRAYLTFLITTGWRFSEAIGLKRSDIDLSSGRIVTRYGSNKGKRDDADYLPPGVAEILAPLVGFGPLLFDWPHGRTPLREQFHAIQRAADIHLACTNDEPHECTDACHFYAFHAFRRGYASLNVARLPAAILQKKMRHKSFATTQKYLKLGDAMKDADDDVWRPKAAQLGGDSTNMEPKATGDAG